MSTAYALTLGLLLSVWLGGSARAQDDESPAQALGPSSIENLPPFPDPMPLQFPSAAAYEDALRSRLYDVTLRQEGLTVLGKPPAARNWKITGWVTAGVGLTAGMIGYLSALDQQHDGLFRAMFAVGVVGGAVCLSGFVILLTAPRNPYRYEIRDLHREAKRIEGELRRLKWEPIQAQLNLSQRGIHLTVRF